MVIGRSGLSPVRALRIECCWHPEALRALEGDEKGGEVCDDARWECGCVLLSRCAPRTAHENWMGALEYRQAPCRCGRAAVGAGGLTSSLWNIERAHGALARARMAVRFRAGA